MILDSEGEWEVSPAPKPLATKPDSDGSALQSTLPTHDDNAAKFGFSRSAQVRVHVNPVPHPSNSLSQTRV